MKHEFRTASEAPISEIEIRSLVDNFMLYKHRYENLEDYYAAKHRAILAVNKDTGIPNNKIINAYPKYITDVQTGYFMGQPVSYSADDGAEDVLEKLQVVFDYNDEQAENAELAKYASVCGRSFELLYADEDGNARFTCVSPTEMFQVLDTSVENNMVCAIRTYAYKLYDGSVIKYVQCYDKYSTRYFEYDEEGFRLVDEQPNYFGDVPVVVYENNGESMGDFEHVLTEIDAYDKQQSNTLNDMEQFTDAYLKFKNLSGTTKEDVKEMKDNRILLLDETGDADWLIKNVNDAWIENFKTRLQNDIHKFSGTPDLTDENFGSNLSGVSLRYKLLAMEQIRATKERYFKKGLQRRIELLCNFLRITTNIGDYTKINMKFNNILPQNLLEASQIVGNLAPYLSKETLLSLLPFVENAQEEIDKKEKEDLESSNASYNALMASPQDENQTQQG